METEIQTEAETEAKTENETKQMCLDWKFIPWNIVTLIFPRAHKRAWAFKTFLN